jgi:hypothetical protein
MTGTRGPTGGNVGPTSTGKYSGDKIPSGYKGGKIQQMDDRQIELMNQLYPHLSPDSYLSRLAGGDEGLFEEMERPALRQFGGLMGNLASQFSGQGMGARRSSTFQNATYQAGSDFAQQLQAKRQGLSRQALKDLFEMSNQLMGQRPYERTLTKKQESPWAGIFGKLGGVVPGLVSSWAGGGSPSSAIEGASSIF